MKPAIIISHYTLCTLRYRDWYLTRCEMALALCATEADVIGEGTVAMYPAVGYGVNCTAQWREEGSTSIVIRHGKAAGKETLLL